MIRLLAATCATLCAASAWSYVVSGPVHDSRAFADMQERFERVREDFRVLQEMRREAAEAYRAGEAAARSSLHDAALAEAALRRQERLEVHNAEVAARGEPPVSDYTCSTLATSVAAATTSSTVLRDATARAHKSGSDGLALGDHDCTAPVPSMPPIAQRATALDADASPLFSRYGYDDRRAADFIGLITPLHPLSPLACRQRDATQQTANARRVLAAGIVRNALHDVVEGHMRMSASPQKPGVPRVLNEAATEHVAWRVLLLEQAQRAASATSRHRTALTIEALLATRLLQRLQEAEDSAP